MGHRHGKDQFVIHLSSCCAAAICAVMLALVDWPAEAAKAQELIARAAAEAAAEVAEAEEEAAGDAVPDLEAAPAVQAAPQRAGAAPATLPCKLSVLEASLVAYLSCLPPVASSCQPPHIYPYRVPTVALCLTVARKAQLLLLLHKHEQNCAS